MNTSMLKTPSLNVGDTLVFGRYPQGADGLASTPIEWQVLEADGTAAMLISRCALDCRPYNAKEADVTWETCTLRTWLNGTFLKSAFSEQERKMLRAVPLQAEENPESDPGKATGDQVCLLSAVEAERHFGTDPARVCKPTAWAKARGAWTDNSGSCGWWLRSPGGSLCQAAFVNYFGSVRADGFPVHAGSRAVRPVIVIGLADFAASRGSDGNTAGRRQAECRCETDVWRVDAAGGGHNGSTLGHEGLGGGGQRTEQEGLLAH